MDLFSHARQEQNAREAPLAARMRPRTLDEFVGQDAVVGPGRLLRRAIQADQLSSLILCGPPGTGKTTLAMVIANTTRSRFVTLNAVLAGVKDIRQVTAQAQEERSLYGRRTILFVDEVHRWNKAQQDALLPWVENGNIIMIGATTENPWFSVNRALLSRSRVFQLSPLTEADLRTVAERTLADQERGYGRLQVNISSDALEHLVDVANGDARSLLNALELAVTTTPPDDAGTIVIDMAVAEESIQRRAVLYDREGDYHFDTISAFIKSVRGSDPDAALYWLAKMVYAGEDPRYIFRRLLILASEDIGLADPLALTVVESAASAYERVGLPEGNFHLTQATLYLATALKSNSTLAFYDALKTVENERDSDVPRHLKDASRDREGFGHGEGYQYPHAFREHWVAQQYLPNSLQGTVFYQPTEQGYESQVRERVLRRREEQIESLADLEAHGDEVVTFSPADQTAERWLARAVTSTGHTLGKLRDRLFESAQIARHHTLLDLNARGGLLTWEALRRAPEGGVWTLARDVPTAQRLQERAASLPGILRPVILQGTISQIPDLLARQDHDDLLFDAIVGRNSLTHCQDRPAAARTVAGLLAPQGRLCLAEVIPGEGQRIYDLVDTSALDARLVARWREAEEAIYGDQADPMVNWDADVLRQALIGAGLDLLEFEIARAAQDYFIGSQTLARWFPQDEPVRTEARPTYAARMAHFLEPDQIRTLHAFLSARLVGQTCPWQTTTAYVIAVPNAD